MPQHKKSSKRWLQRQSKDYYAKQALKRGWRSRAAFKLQHIDERHKLLGAGMGVIDLGAAPGGWSQYAVSRVGAGSVVAVDRLLIDPIQGVYRVQGDLFHPDIRNQAISFFKNSHVHLVLSDMSPNITGNSSIDIPKSLDLADAALGFALEVLLADGSFLVKIFQGDGSIEYIAELKNKFMSVKVCKPESSRQESREVYVLAKRPKERT